MCTACCDSTSIGNGKVCSAQTTPGTTAPIEFISVPFTTPVALLTAMVVLLVAIVESPAPSHHCTITHNSRDNSQA